VNLKKSRRKPNATSLQRIDVLVKTHKQWDHEWEKWVDDTKEKDPSYLQICDGIFQSMVRENVSCDVVKEVVPKCGPLCYNDVCQMIFAER
jgi:hypothetical protein